MTSKPEWWCPQDVWEYSTAEAATFVQWLEPRPLEYEQAEHVLSVSIAHAILAERERCARASLPPSERGGEE